jgi:hypothetical protein
MEESMSMIEIQIRADRFCELVKGELNSRPLPSPTVDAPGLKGKPLEKIECVSCSLGEPSNGSGVVTVTGNLAFRYHTSLATVRAVGSLKPAATAEEIRNFELRLHIAFEPFRPSPREPPVLRPVLKYDLWLFGFIQGSPEHGLIIDRGNFPVDFPDQGPDQGPRSAAIEASASVVAIRIGTQLDDPVHAPPVDRTGQDEWVQLITGAYLAEEVRGMLDRALDAADEEPPPDPDKPWLPKPKHQKLRKDDAAVAVWEPYPEMPPYVLAQGDIIAVNACEAFDVDISIELSLSVWFAFPDRDTMRTTATLTWDADSTWCDVWSTVFIGVPFGIAFHVFAEDEISESVLGKSLAPGGGRYREIGRTDESITYERLTWAPSTPSREFVRRHAEVTTEGLVIGGLIRPKVAYALAGKVIPATSGLAIDCRLQKAGMIFNPAQVVLRNAAAGYIGRPPHVWLEKTVFDPVDAWTIKGGGVNRSDPYNTSPQTVLTFVDPVPRRLVPPRLNTFTSPIELGRLPAGTRTSVFLFTDYGVRWVDLGVIPDVPEPPDGAEDLAQTICGSISNPFARGMTRLDWEVDPLLDPDYKHLFGIEAVRLWSIGLRELPNTARIEFVALAPDGSERLLGLVEGQRSAALQLVTDANETLAIRPDKPFSAPPPTLSRSWIFPFAAYPLDFEPMTIASAAGLIGLSGPDGIRHIVNPRELDKVGKEDQGAARRSDLRDRRITHVLAQEEARGRKAWATATRLDKDTVAVIHRGQVLVGAVGASHRVQ